MANSEWSWRRGENPPVVQPHTVRKHDLYASYVREYISILGNAAWRRQQLGLTIIDAFAGGGEFLAADSTGGRTVGSPLRLIEAASEAVQELKDARGRFGADIRFWFNDKSEDNAAHLRETLKGKGHVVDGQQIRVTTGSFVDQAAAMISAVKEQQPKAGKCLLFVDQTGWKDAPVETLRTFFEALPGYEIILTLSAGLMLNPKYGQRLAEWANASTSDWIRLDVLRQFREDMERAREEPTLRAAETSRALALRKIMSEMAMRTGTRAFSAFTLVPRVSNNYLWILHMTRSQGAMRARNAMIDVQWQLNGVTTHLGGIPEDYLGYQGLRVGDNQLELDSYILAETQRENLRKKFAQAMIENVVHKRGLQVGGIRVAEILRETDNKTALTTDDRVRALTQGLKKEGQGRRAIRILDCNGREVGSGGRRLLKPDDILVPPQQGVFLL